MPLKLNVKLICGDAHFDILGIDPADYPDLPEVEDQYGVSIQQNTLKAMIGQTAFAVSSSTLTAALRAMPAENSSFLAAR